MGAVWLSFLVEQTGRGLAGMALGIPMQGLVVSASRHYAPVVTQGPLPASGPWSWLFMLLAGPVLVLVVALLFYGLAGLIRASVWIRSFALVWVVVALVWIPVALVSAALPGGGGPVAELYSRLGAPRAGRWTAGALGLLLLVLVAGPISVRAINVGRSWMRADAVEFRRRLTRVTAGWPGVVVVGAMAFWAGWAATPWAAGLMVAVLAAVHFRTK